MGDLHAALLAAIEEQERAATYDRNMGHYRRAAIDYPAHVLRGCAEDRDILRRHRQEYDYCSFCTTIGWPCLEVISLIRRHGIEVPS